MGNTLAALSTGRASTTAPAAPHKVLFTGMYSAGKTTLQRKLGKSKRGSTIPTTVFSEMPIEGIEMMTGELGGRTPMRVYERQIYDEVQGIVYVIDASNRIFIEWTGSEISHLMAEEKLLGMPLLVAVNKTDLPHAMTLEEVSEKLGLPTVVQERGPRSYRVIGCSVQDLGGLKEGLAWLQKEMSALPNISDNKQDNDDAETVLSAEEGSSDEEAEAPPPRGKPLGGAGEGMVEDPTLVSAISDERLFSSGGILAATN